MIPIGIDIFSQALRSFYEGIEESPENELVDELGNGLVDELGNFLIDEL